MGCNVLQALQSKVDIILNLENRLMSLTVERDEALQKAESINTNWREEESRIRQEIDVQNEKMKAVVQQNELLLNEIQELSLKMAVAQGRVSNWIDSRVFQKVVGNSLALLKVLSKTCLKKKLSILRSGRMLSLLIFL